MEEPQPSPPASRRLFVVSFWAFLASMIFAVAGTLLLQLFPASARVFAPYMQQLVNGPTMVYMALLPVLSFALFYETLGLRRSVLFLLVGSLVGAASELIGTNTGFPFGPYSYTERLGPKILGDVPWFIPPSWYALSILCYDLARRLTESRVLRVLAVAVFMILWDVSLDPAMNQAGGTFVFWLYPEGGPYFGMPWSNWFGWFVTSAVIGVGYEALGGLGERATRFERRWTPRLYALHLLFPVAICMLYDLPEAGVLGLVAMAIPLGLVYRRERSLGPSTAPE